MNTHITIRPEEHTDYKNAIQIFYISAGKQDMVITRCTMVQDMSHQK